jgi:hypothetical protein
MAIFTQAIIISVITIMGITGTITDITVDTIIIEVDCPF